MRNNKQQPAFPLPDSTNCDGITKLEYFTAAALQGLLQNININNSLKEDEEDHDFKNRITGEACHWAAYCIENLEDLIATNHIV